MSWDVGLAGMFKERNPKSLIGPCVGKVVSVYPLKISILNGEVVLESGQLYITRRLLSLELNKGDKVLLIPAESEQTFFIIDIVEKVGG